jgi:serine/threonine protein kinase/Tol biopolymer transport system component
MIGKTLGHYRVGEQLGRGGMGEVYVADDLNLNRKVALKFLPEAFTGDPERMARFEREAKLLASLNHPNIAGIYGLEEAEGKRFIVMELVEGETLAERIARAPGRAPLQIDETLDICRQIAQGLEAAHEKGVIHRDLKPANVMITEGDKVKILDFGLAKALSGEIQSVDSSHSPTITEAMTRPGIVLGTAAYMSPEQAKGKAVDKRADIWAFGCILYECLTGKRTFESDTVTETLAAILRSDPDWQALPATIPANIRFLLQRCLDKDVKRRFRDAADLSILIDAAGSMSDAASPAKRRRSWIAWSAAAIMAVALILVLWLPWRAERRAEQPLVRLDVDLGPDVSLYVSAGPDVIISPDGKRIVFVSKSRLFTRRLDKPNITELPGTEGAMSPFFSPDSQWVAFYAGGKLKKIAVEGGAAVTLCDASQLRGGSWGEDGNIIAGLLSSGPLSRIPSAGGIPTPVTELDQGEATHRWPQILPGGKAVLFTSHTSTVGFDRASIEVMSLGDHRRKTLQRGGTYGRYLPSGHLVYLNKGTLFAVPFDLEKLEVRGSPSPVLEEVASIQSVGSPKFDFSQNGTVVYRIGIAGSELATLQWLDGTGRTQPLPANPGLFLQQRLSPDGRLLALAKSSGDDVDIWTYDWQRDAMTRVTFGNGNFSWPVWGPDSRFIVFYGVGGIFWARADGAGKPQLLIQSKKNQYPFSISPDGKQLAFAQLNQAGRWDLWTVPLETQHGEMKAGSPEIFLQTSANTFHPAFSPDGRWIAYMSRESGKAEIYVRAFPDKGGRWQVSNSGGYLPIWSRNGRELFYRTEGQQIMVATYTVKGDSFAADKPRIWTEKRLADTGTSQNLDIAPDGKRFVVLMPADVPEDQKAQNHVTFLLNFFDELRRLVPATAK